MTLSLPLLALQTCQALQTWGSKRAVAAWGACFCHSHPKRQERGLPKHHCGLVARRQKTGERSMPLGDREDLPPNLHLWKKDDSDLPKDKRISALSPRLRAALRSFPKETKVAAKSTRESAASPLRSCAWSQRGSVASPLKGEPSRCYLFHAAPACLQPGSWLSLPTPPSLGQQPQMMLCMSH